MDTAIIIRRKRKGDGRWMQLVTEGRVGPEADVERREEETTSLIGTTLFSSVFWAMASINAESCEL